MTRLDIIAFTPNVADESEGKAADAIIATISFHMTEARKMGALAKSALHQVMRHKPTYSTNLKKKETKARRAVIEKNDNLGASYYAAKEAFQYHGRIVADLLFNDLVGQMPLLIKGGGRYDSTVPSYGRKSNVTLSSRLMKSIPVDLARIAAEFAPRDLMDVCSSNCELSTLRSNLEACRDMHRFEADLNVPFVLGVDPGLAELEKALAALETALERHKLVVKELADAKSRYFADSWDDPASWTPGCPDVGREYVELQVDYEMARWAVENANEDVWQQIHWIERELKTVNSNLRQMRPFNIASNNVVSAYVKVVAAQNAVRAANRHVTQPRGDSHQDVKTRARMDRSYKALHAAYEAIPAQHQRPFMPFLDH